jgi:hypothetical protein
MLLFFILFGSNNILFGQGLTDIQLQKQLSCADSVLSAGSPFDAVTEYERVIFFDSSRTYACRAFQGEAQAYGMGGKYDQSILALRNALQYTQDSVEMIRIYQSLLQTSIRARKFSLANIFLRDVIRFRNIQDDRYYSYWQGWISIFRDDWGSASEYFAKSDTAKELCAYCAAIDDKMKSPMKAKIMSAIIPGSGSMYAGHWVNGAISLAWNVLFGYLAVVSFIEERVFDGILISQLLWMRFYSGSSENAEKFVREENRNQSNHALEYLEYQFQGVKP